jgi:hypothetical protein
LTHIGGELVSVVVFTIFQLLLDRIQIHRLRDLIEVVGDAICNGINSVTKGTNKTGPEACNV